MTTPKKFGRTKQEAAEMGQKRQCLGCERKVGDDENYRRGLCQSCYSDADRRKIKKQLTFDQLVESGLMLPASNGGRKKKSDKPSVFAAFVQQQRVNEAAGEIGRDIHQGKGLRPGRKKAKKS